MVVVMLQRPAVPSFGRSPRPRSAQAQQLSESGGRVPRLHRMHAMGEADPGGDVSDRQQPGALAMSHPHLRVRSSHRRA